MRDAIMYAHTWIWHRSNIDKKACLHFVHFGCEKLPVVWLCDASCDIKLICGLCAGEKIVITLLQVYSSALEAIICMFWPDSKIDINMAGLEVRKRYKHKRIGIHVDMYSNINWNAYIYAHHSSGNQPATVCILYVTHLFFQWEADANALATHSFRRDVWFNYVACVQDAMADTSSAEIARRTHTARGRKQYYDWDAKEQKSAIKACGISVGNFGQNKTRRKKILERLSRTDLPTDAGAVWRKIRAMQLDPSGYTSMQQR